MCSGRAATSHAEGGRPRAERSSELPHEGLRCLYVLHELSEEAELSDHFVCFVEELPIALERGKDEDGASLALCRQWAIERPATELGGVVLEYIAHVGRL